MKHQEKPRIVIATIIYCTSTLSGQLCRLRPLSLTYYTILHYSLTFMPGHAVTPKFNPGLGGS